jgi:hypothetical protein
MLSGETSRMIAEKIHKIEGTNKKENRRRREVAMSWKVSKIQAEGGGESGSEPRGEGGREEEAS